MKQIKELCRLHLEHKLSLRGIAGACNMSVSTVQGYVKRLEESGLGWPQIEALGQHELTELMQIKKPAVTAARPKPDLQYVAREMKRKGVTLQLLWEEYLQEHPGGYGRSRFYGLYREWVQATRPTMRLQHRAGEKAFVDFSGAKPAYRDPATGQLLEVELYVAVLGASSYTYACAVASQKSADFIEATMKALEFFGGCPACLVIDNLKSGVSHACYWDPEINQSFAEMACHYGLAVLPTRVKKPKDKAKVESGVQNVQRRILAALRNREFFSLQELNGAIAGEVQKLNARPMQVTGRSRQELFDEFEKAQLRALPPVRFSISHWKKAKVHIDYHVDVEKTYYSVPYSLIGKTVDIQYNQHLVQIYCNGRRVASHLRVSRPGKYLTDNAHMPHEHRYYLEWNPERIQKWGATIGPHTSQLMQKIMQSKPHPEHGFRGCLGIIRLSRSYGPERVEQASYRALQLEVYSFRSIKSMLAKGLDKVVQLDTAQRPESIDHENLRGEHYYDADSHT
jgi:transposase